VIKSWVGVVCDLCGVFEVFFEQTNEIERSSHLSFNQMQGGLQLIGTSANQWSTGVVLPKREKKTWGRGPAGVRRFG